MVCGARDMRAAVPKGPESRALTPLSAPLPWGMNSASSADYRSSRAISSALSYRWSGSVWRCRSPEPCGQVDGSDVMSRKAAVAKRAKREEMGQLRNECSREGGWGLNL